ncbi:hypothetical protein GCM10010466_33540 [Planomonospora alba]|uniref:Uncharacterized protein n=1 Tax=Planomonospora alba TaxID=161354 RepID=A0ABP6N8C2_9ACTN
MAGGQASHWGRPKSWLAVSVVAAGFAVGGVALTLGPNWALLWTGIGICVLGGILIFAFGVFSDVVLDAPRQAMVIEDVHRESVRREDVHREDVHREKA